MSKSGSNGGQSTPGPKPSTSKQAMEVAENDMDMSLPAVDFTKLVYDKGHIMEWLTYSVASVQAVLAGNEKKISVDLEELMVANIPELLEEDFRSCRTTENFVLKVTDQIDIAIKQLLREKNNMLSGLNIRYPGIEPVKPATVTRTTTEVQTDLTMIEDKGTMITTAVQTARITQRDVSCETEGQVGSAISSQDQSTSMEGCEDVVPILATSSVQQDPTDGSELMEVLESGTAEDVDTPFSEEPIAGVATSSDDQDVEQSVKKPGLEPLDAIADSPSGPNEPSSPNVSDADNLKQGENYEIIIPQECRVTVDVIPQILIDYLMQNGSIRIKKSESPDISHEDRDLEGALRSLETFDADLPRRQEMQRNRSAIRKQKRAETLRSSSQDIHVRDIDADPPDEVSVFETGAAQDSIFDQDHMDLDDLGDADDGPSSLDHGVEVKELKSAEFNIDEGFRLSDESAAMNSLFGAEVQPDSEWNAAQASENHEGDPRLNTVAPNAETNVQTVDASVESDGSRKRKRPYIPNDCVATTKSSEIIEVELDDSDGVEVIDLTHDDRNTHRCSKNRKKRRTTSHDSESNPSEPVEDLESDPDSLWPFQEIPSTSNSEIKPDVKPLVDLTTSSQADEEIQCVGTELMKTVIKKEPGSRRNIRPILQEDALSIGTRRAEEEEKAKQQRIERHQEEILTVATSGALVLDQYEGKQLKVHDLLLEKLKPHQKEGIRFMWNGCFETVETYLNSKHEGAGCILAHCMGLGKTLTAITFMHTILTFPPLDISRVLVLCPSGIVENWYTELNRWLKRINRPRKVQIFNFQKPGKNLNRSSIVQRWAVEGGIGIMSYTSFRLCCSTAKRANTSKAFLLEGAEQHLLEAPVVICDEGHTLKNKNTQTFKAVQRIKTKRRIILTGTPMQNNLNEYYCMVSFVRPQLLGTPEEFNNQFGNPILNGQMLDSTEQDVIVMRRRSSILYEKLKGTCHREGVDVLKGLIPPKQEFTLLVELCEVQKNLYNKCLQSQESHRVMTVYSLLSKILCHPKALSMGKTEPSMSDDREDIVNAVMQILKFSETQVVRSAQEGPSTSKEEIERKQSTAQPSHYEIEDLPAAASKPMQTNSAIPLRWYPNAADEGYEENQPATNMSLEENMTPMTEGHSFEAHSAPATPWWSECLKDVDVDLLEHSNKMVILLELIAHCIKKKEKVLVFSQYVYSLNLIEDFLNEVVPAWLGGPGKWKKNVDYFRMDGTIGKGAREKSNFDFNDTERAKVYLVTSKTGGHGINLVGASRLILFDSSFNPSNDLQCIYRIYRLGQKKPTFVYRLIGGRGTAEHTAYRRQKVKLGISQRVVDDHGTHRCVTKDAYANKIISSLKEQQSDGLPLIPNTSDDVLNKVISSHARLLLDIENGDMEHVEDKLSEDELAKAVSELEQEIKDQQAAAAAKEATTPRKGGKKNKKQSPPPPPSSTY